MNIPKAIKILSDSANRGMTTFDQDLKDAQRLGVEALKRLDLCRAKGDLLDLTPLPGETEE